MLWGETGTQLIATGLREAKACSGYFWSVGDPPSRGMTFRTAVMVATVAVVAESLEAMLGEVTKKGGCDGCAKRRADIIGRRLNTRRGRGGPVGGQDATPREEEKKERHPSRNCSRHWSPYPETILGTGLPIP